MEKTLWENEQAQEYIKYLIAKGQWRSTGFPYFKKEMNLRALTYRVCRSYALQATRRKSQQSHVVPAQVAKAGH